MTKKLQIICPECFRVVEYRRFNARFGNEGYMYCDSDATVLTWNSYDSVYSEISRSVHPWKLESEAKTAVEASVIECPNGGHFRFEANPRCPFCLNELSSLASDKAYFVVTGSRIDGDREPIWVKRGS
jgi:hypothetical protein